MKKEKTQFDFKAFESEAIENLKKGKPLEGIDGVLEPLIKRLVEAGLNGAMDIHHKEKKTISTFSLARITNCLHSQEV